MTTWGLAIWLSTALLLAQDAKDQDIKAQEERIARLIKDLDNEDAHTREKATEELIKIGRPAVEPLKKALANKPTEETKLRIDRILDEIDWPEGGKINDGMQLTIKTDKTTYKEGEEITINIRLKNRSDKKKIVKFDIDDRWDDCLFVYAANDKGEASWLGSVGLIVQRETKETNKEIGAGETLNFDFTGKLQALSGLRKTTGAFICFNLQDFRSPNLHRFQT